MRTGSVLSTLPTVEPQDAERRRLELTTTISALLGAGLLLTAALFEIFEPNRSQFRVPSIIALVAGAFVLTALLVNEAMHRRKTERALTRSALALDRMGQLAEEELEDVRLGDLLHDLAGQACASLDAPWTAILLVAGDGKDSAYEVAAATAGAPRRVGVVMDDRLVQLGTPARATVPLAVEGTLYGLLEVGLPTDRAFNADERALLRLVGERVASTLERARLSDAERRSRLGAARARANLALIADVSIVLARAFDDVYASIRDVADMMLDDFADLCAVYLTRPDGRVARITARHRDGTGALVELAAELAGAAPAVERVRGTRQSELAFVARNESFYGFNDQLARTLRDEGLASWVLSPIPVGDAVSGVLLAGTNPQRRGFRPADQAVIDEIANRVGITVERALLYAESRQAAIAAERRAAQLGRLLEAAIALNPSLRPGELLGALAGQAAAVTDSPFARAWLNPPPARREAAHGAPPSPGVSTESAVVDASGATIGGVRVERPVTAPFTPDDEATLTLLARVASVALQNARLYGDVRDREQRLQALVASSPLGILELDASGKVRAANPAARAMLAASGDGPVALPGAIAHELHVLTARALEGEVADSELSADVGGHRLDVWVSTAPVRGHDGQPVGVLAIVSDTTERNVLKEQLVEAQRYEAIAQLAGGVAHDFNNLLTIILGYSDVLMETFPEGSPEHEDVSAIYQAGHHAGVITNQLLTLSRNQVVRPVVVPVATTVRDLLPMLRRLAGDHIDVVLEAEAAADYEAGSASEPAIEIDAGQLEQVVFNLVLNSRDAMPDGGTIGIRVEPRPASGAGQVAVSVRDEGHGMDAATIERCREPFFTTKGRRGIGLGLSTVSSIVQRAGGRLDIDSELGVGTTITAVFPVYDPSARGAIPEAAAPEDHRRPRVLLVDDDEAVRRFAAKGLADAGFEVTAVDDAAAAIAAAGDTPFDLIVSDIVLDGMSGVDLVRLFGERWPATARLLVTGFAETGVAGADLDSVQVLRKPFAADELVRAAHDALRAVYGSKR